MEIAFAIKKPGQKLGRPAAILLQAGKCLFILLFLTMAAYPGEKEIKPAKVRVKGYGFFGNRELQSLVAILRGSSEKPEFLDASYVEDAVLILFSRLQRDGYLYPVLHANVLLDDGTERVFTWREPLGEALPRPFRARKLEFKIDKGVLFYFDEVRFEGLEGLSLQEAEHFFIETDALIPLKKNRIYSPERLRAGIKNLEEGLERLGYQRVAATATNLIVQTNTGSVSVDILVQEGPQSIVRTVQKEIVDMDTNQAHRVQTIQTNAPYSRMWQQDLEQALKREQYIDGYADVRVEITPSARETHAETNEVKIDAKVFPGNQIHIGQIRFEGAERTREAMMRRRINVESGELLNRIEAEKGRYRLARLGVFDSVELRYDKVNEDVRDLVYTVDEGKRIDFSILAGYGSYEKLRGGFELEQYNLWGLAHHSRLKAVQSFKSSSAEYTYTMPELLGENFDVFVNASGLIREEPAFTRQEFGGGAGVSRRFRTIATDVSLRYNYQVLSAAREDIPPADGLDEATVGSFIFDIRHDRRDNPLTPRSGYKVFSTLEVASETLLGDVDFQRMETSIAYHHALGRVRWLHLGISHGFVTTASGPARDLPFNKRFFPGGDNSIRGYQFGEAGARNEFGQLVGSETYTVANVELEQGLTRSWSLVVFFDALGQARRIENYPFNEGLYSVGGGVRWKTIIGPVRLEYGRNLNPREADPGGTLHVSIGFPF
jgi:outer membrane protein insertion porin family